MLFENIYLQHIKTSSSGATPSQDTSESVTSDDTRPSITSIECAEVSTSIRISFN